MQKIKDTLQERIKRTLHIGRAMRLVWLSAPKWTVANIALVTVQGFLPLILLYLIKLIIDRVTGGIVGVDQAAAFKGVSIFIVMAGLVILLNALCRTLAEFARETQSQIVTDYVSDVIHAKSVEIDLGYYEVPKYHDTLHRAQQEAPYRPTRIVNGIIQLVQNGISLLALSGLLIFFHWAAAVILFAATIPGLFLRLRYADALYNWQQERTQLERRSYYLHWMLTDSSHAKEIRLFGLGSLLIDWFRGLRKILRREKLQIARKRSLFELLTQACAAMAILGVFLLIAYQALQGAITVGSMVMYYQAFQRAQGSLQELLSSLSSLYEDNLFLSNFYEFLDLQPHIVEPSRPDSFPHPVKKGIVFDHVSFTYPAGVRAALDDISLHIAPGKVVALVGENGSGKTTLVKLLCRLYDPTKGKIVIDDKDLRQLKSAALRKEIGVIFQDYVRYNLTARENIWFGNVNLSPDDARIASAAQQTGAEAFIKKLPKGYDTMLGHRFDGGAEISIGEWQKVALARAFLRDTQIVILDEPTSAMDAKAEYEVFDAFRQLLNGRTGILISHRFSTVRMADYIYVLERGKIIEAGTHKDLVRQGGKYATFFEMQAKHYR